MITRRLAAASLALFAACAAHAQDFPPKKQITMMVGFAAGGGSDTAARLIAQRLSTDLGQSVVVDNRAGGGGIVAHQLTVSGPTDGSLILMGSIGPLAISPHLIKLPFDPQRDLAPLTMGVNFPNVLIVSRDLGVKTLAEFIALAKKEPGKLNFASTGAGSAAHLAGELFNQRAGVEIVHVPYKGGAPAMVDLMAGRVSAYYATPSTAAPYIEAGKVVALATTGLERPAGLPNLPTIAESGFPGFSATNWYAFVAPAKTPKPILDGWNKALVKVLSDPEVKAQLDKHGLTPMPTSREELGRFIAAESTTWGKVVRERKITAE
ncbi:MAG: tripartite tricarboxylate transporter substrate binding protein [Pseudomonadota bacterium]